MTMANTVFNAYLDANIILLFSATIWMATSFFLRRTRLREAYSARLQMLYAVFFTVALSPIILLVFHAAREAGWIGAGVSLSISDFAVARFLDGHISMAPSRFETLLAARDVLTLNVTSLGSVWGVAVVILLFAGTFWFAIRTVRNGFHISRLVRSAYVWRRIGRVEIRLTDRTHMPFSTRGVRTHYIVIPSALLSQSNDLRIAIAHELQHMRQRDLFWEIVLEVLRPLFFWNPAFRFWKHEAEKLRELACDHAVLTRRGIGVRSYCECLLRICHNNLKRGGGGQMLVPAVPFAQIERGKSGGRSARVLKRRVVSMLDGARREPGRLIRLGMTLAMAGMITLGAIASQPAGDWSQDRLMLSAIVNLERMGSRNGFGN